MELVAGVDIGGTKVIAGLVDGRGTIAEQVEGPTEPEAGTRSVIETLHALFDKRGGASAIGVAAAAFVSHPSGRIVFAPNLRYDDPELGTKVAEEFNLPVVVENDANSAAWGERLFGAARGIDDLVMVTVGTGIGGGIVVGGELFRGSRGFAGELGHITLVEDGPQCACGRRGCLEALASGSAIERMANEGRPNNSDSLVFRDLDESTSVRGEAVAAAALAGDQFARSIFARAGYWLGVGLANITYMFDPEVLVVGGGVAAAGPLLLQPATDQLDAAVASRREVPRVLQATLGNDAGMIGIAALARDLIRKR